MKTFLTRGAAALSILTLVGGCNQLVEFGQSLQRDDMGSAADLRMAPRDMALATGDMQGVPDLAMAADLAQMPDLAMPPSPDLAMPPLPDLAMPPLPDLAMPPVDMAIQADMSVPPDLLSLPDLALLCTSAEFDGKMGSLITAPHLAAYNPAGPLTIEAWFRVKAFSPNGGVLAGHIDSMPKGYDIEVDDTGRTSFSITGNNGADATTIGSINSVTIGTWHHFAGVYDGAGMWSFIDGVPIGTKPSQITFKPDAVTVPFTIGDAENVDVGFNGDISEVRLSSVARYNAMFVPARRFAPDANTLALFHLSEPIASMTATDASASKNNGTVQGGTSFTPMCP